jgi:hypothetical protein
MSAENVVMSGSVRVRLRIRFAKLGKIRWTSHRDLARMWERAFRRVQLPLAYSEGFSPRPKVSFGLALPTGYESVAEFLDVELEVSPEGQPGGGPASGAAGAVPQGSGGVDLANLVGRLSEALPVGVDATAVSVIRSGTPSLQEDVTSCSWRWVAAPAEGAEPLAAADLADRLSKALASPSLVITRSRKGSPVTEDVRAGILDVQLVGPVGADLSEGMWLEAELSCRPRTVRPTEVLIAIGPGLEERLVRRTHQWILRDGARREPLAETGEGDATDAPHALERAS